MGDELTIEHLAKLPWVVTFREPLAFSTAQRQLRMLGIEPQVRVVVETHLPRGIHVVLHGENGILGIGPCGR